jgi:hypothetical protein
MNGGQQYVFSKKLDAFHGEGTAEAILKLSNETRKFSRQELEDMYRYYKKRVDEIKQSRGME